MQKIILILILVISFSTAQAVYTEVGLSGSYKQETIDANNYTRTQAGSVDLAFYFWQFMGVEFAYTDARQEQRFRFPDGSVYDSTLLMQYLSSDLILSTSDRRAAFQPYIKVGVTDILKKSQLIEKSSGFSELIEVPSGVVPSAGIGMKLLLTETFALKIGIDYWQSKDEYNNTTNDYVGRFGITWML